MNWLMDTMFTSIGKKFLMALTGLIFCSFLAVHLAGNLTLYAGGDFFNAYAEKLHMLGKLITIAEWGLVIFALIHVVTGLLLFYQNFTARPVRYKVDKWAGGRTWGSATMPYTGVLLLIFIIFHLVNFHFADRSQLTLYQIVSAAFAKPDYVIIYVVAMLVAALHVSHGFWSAFQTIGANHPKYMPLIRGAGIVFSVAVAVGFGFIPVYISFFV